jgi:hypothetical protein
MYLPRAAGQKLLQGGGLGDLKRCDYLTSASGGPLAASNAQRLEGPETTGPWNYFWRQKARQASWPLLVDMI